MHIIDRIGIYLAIIVTVLCLPSIIFGAPLVNTNKQALIKLIEELDKLKLKKSIKSRIGILDLGAGTGKTVELFNSLGYRAEGYEINPWLYIIAKLKGRPVKFANYLKKDLDGFDIIYIFSAKPYLNKNSKKLTSCKSIIISYGFSLDLSNHQLFQKSNGFFIYTPKLRS